jgi:DNA helicase-2/ATP-dependent DNA helicase PcrA
MLEVSKYLSSKQAMRGGKILPAINHEVSIEAAGPALAAILIAGLLEQNFSEMNILELLIRNLCEHIRGRRGDLPAIKKELEFSSALLEYIESNQIRGKNRLKCVNECIRIADECQNINLTGEPYEDWIVVRNILQNAAVEEIKRVSHDAHYIRLLGKGAQLRSSLDELWRLQGNYSGAMMAVRNSLLQEHFAASTKVWTGIQVMTMHKAKGKEFDEVIIYEGLHQGKIANKKNLEQSRLNLRVSVTRAVKRVTILTPQNDICEFLA